MPSIRDFESRAGKGGKKMKDGGKPADASEKKSAARRRRPGRPDSEPVPVEAQEVPPSPATEFEAKPERRESGGFTSDAPGMENEFQSAEDEKFRLEFTGSEFLRAKAPQAFDLAETVVDEWVKDGRFEGLPVGHPLAQMAAQVTLLKAKKVEKKLEEKGVFALAKMGLAYAKSKLGRS